MGSFSSDEETGSHRESVDSSNSRFFYYLFYVVFFPGVAFGILKYYVLFRRMKRRVSIVIGYDIAILVTALLFSYLFNVLGLAYYAVNILSPTWVAKDLIWLLPLWLVACVIVGTFMGTLATVRDSIFLKKNPWILEISDRWTHNFTYALTPLERRDKKQKINKLKSGSVETPSLAVPLGIDVNTRNIVYRYEEEAVRGGTLITGSPGSGKTVTMQTCIRNDLLNKISVIMVDFKSSPENSAKLAHFAHETGADFYHFTSGSQDSYNIPNSPGLSDYDMFATASWDARREMVLNMREYDTASDHYKQLMNTTISMIFTSIQLADRSKTTRLQYVDTRTGTIIKSLQAYASENKLTKEQVSSLVNDGVLKQTRVDILDWDSGLIYLLRSIMKDNNFEVLMEACKHHPLHYDDMVEFWKQVSTKNSDANKQYRNLASQMTTLTNSQYGQWLKIGNGVSHINLHKLTSGDKPAVILFSIDSDAEKDFSKFLGSLIFSDLSSVASYRRRHGFMNPVHVYADEFQAVPPTSIKGLMEKARDAVISIVLACQSFDQIITASEANGEATLRGLLDTCKNFIIHQGSTYESAERLSGIVGKELSPEYTVEGGSKHGLSEILTSFMGKRKLPPVRTKNVDKWTEPPQVFMNLKSPTKGNGYVSTAVVVNKTVEDEKESKKGGATARVVQIIPPDSVSMVKLYHGDLPVVQQDSTSAEEDFSHDEPVYSGEGSVNVLDLDYLYEDSSYEDEEVSEESPRKEVIAQGWSFEDIEESTPVVETTYQKMMREKKERMSRNVPRTSPAPSPQSQDGFNMMPDL